MRYKALYPGIDLEITSEQGQLVQRLIVWDDAELLARSINSLQQVRWQIEGAAEVSVSADELRLSTALGDVILPLLYVVDADRLPFELSMTQTEVNDFSVSAPFASPFRTKIDEASEPLALTGASDLLFSTFLGGDGTFDNGHAITYDAAGYAYVTGQADPGFPATPGAFDTSIDGVYNDVFVVKLTPDGSNLVFATFIGGSDWEISHGINADGVVDIIDLVIIANHYDQEVPGAESYGK